MDLVASVRAFVEVEASIVAMARLRNQLMDEILSALPAGSRHLSISDEQCHYFIESDDFAVNEALDILDSGLFVQVIPEIREKSEWRGCHDGE